VRGCYTYCGDMMKITKYIKKGNGNYQVLFSDGKKINLQEDVIIKYNLLYKKDIDYDILSEVIKDNDKYDIYNKCVNYIGVRLRSINEIREYMERKDIPIDVIDIVIDKLIKNKLLDDEVFTRAFIKDKMNFTTMGPYRIELELKKHRIDDKIIKKYIYEIDDNLLVEKINKQINKLIKSNRNKNNIRNKIYNNLLSLGYSSEFIVDNLNKYNL
jgi:recX family